MKKPATYHPSVVMEVMNLLAKQHHGLLKEICTESIPKRLG